MSDVTPERMPLSFQTTGENSIPDDLEKLNPAEKLAAWFIDSVEILMDGEANDLTLVRPEGKLADLCEPDEIIIFQEDDSHVGGMSETRWFGVDATNDYPAATQAMRVFVTYDILPGIETEVEKVVTGIEIAYTLGGHIVIDSDIQALTPQEIGQLQLTAANLFRLANTFDIVES